MTCRHATSRAQRHSAHSTACRAAWLYAPGFLNLVQPPQVAAASRSKLAPNPRSVSGVLNRVGRDLHAEGKAWRLAEEPAETADRLPEETAEGVHPLNISHLRK